MDDRTKAFKRELAALLEKHGAALTVILEGDTIGTHDEGLGVVFLESDAAQVKTWSEEERLCEGMVLRSAGLTD